MNFARLILATTASLVFAFTLGCQPAPTVNTSTSTSTSTAPASDTADSNTTDSNTTVGSETPGDNVTTGGAAVSETP